MNRKQSQLLGKLENEHIRLRGCIEALLLMDDNPNTHWMRQREAAAALHIIASDTLRDADATLSALYKSRGKAA